MPCNERREKAHGLRTPTLGTPRKLPCLGSKRGETPLGTGRAGEVTGLQGPFRLQRRRRDSSSRQRPLSRPKAIGAGLDPEPSPAGLARPVPWGQRGPRGVQSDLRRWTVPGAARATPTEAQGLSVPPRPRVPPQQRDARPAHPARSAERGVRRSDGASGPSDENPGEGAGDSSAHRTRCLGPPRAEPQFPPAPGRERSGTRCCAACAEAEPVSSGCPRTQPTTHVFLLVNCPLRSPPKVAGKHDQSPHKQPWDRGTSPRVLARPPRGRGRGL